MPSETDFLRATRTLAPALQRANTARDLAAYYLDQFSGQAPLAATYLLRRARGVTMADPARARLYRTAARILEYPGFPGDRPLYRVAWPNGCK